MSKHFDAVAQDWDADDFKHQLSSTIANAIKSALPDTQSMQIMDFGAGTGLLTQNFYEASQHLTAVDISQAMLDQLAKKVHLKDKLSIICQDITHEPLEQQFDAVISAMAMHHVEDTQALLASFAKQLPQGGWIAIADLDSEDGSFHPASMDGIFHHGFDRDSLKKLASTCGFKAINFSTPFVINKDGKEFSLFLLTAQKA